MNDLGFLIAVLGFALVLVAVACGLHFIYGYRVTDRAVEVLLFHALPICRVPLHDIADIRTVHRNQLMFDLFAFRFGNRFARHLILIQKRRGWFRRIVITPPDLDEFIEQVKAAEGYRGAA
jgi:hypothetical protein